LSAILPICLFVVRSNGGERDAARLTGGVTDQGPGRRITVADAHLRADRLGAGRHVEHRSSGAVGEPLGRDRGAAAEGPSRAGEIVGRLAGDHRVPVAVPQAENSADTAGSVHHEVSGAVAACADATETAAATAAARATTRPEKRASFIRTPSMA
jgi:hypothetical protein